MNKSGFQGLFYAVMKEAVGSGLFLSVNGEDVPGQIKLTAHPLVHYSRYYGAAWMVGGNQGDGPAAARNGNYAF